MALAVDVTNLELKMLSVKVPVCEFGTADLSKMTFSYRAYFDGVPLQPPQPANFYLDAYDPDASTGYLGLDSVIQGVWLTYFAPLNTAASNTTQITIDAGSFGGQFSGTVWIDDITVQ